MKYIGNFVKTVVVEAEDTEDAYNKIRNYCIDKLGGPIDEISVWGTAGNYDGETEIN